MSLDDDNGVSEYLARVGRLLEEVASSQRPQLARFAQLWAQAIASDKLLYVFGSGHSRFIAGELHWRAGGLAPVVTIEDPGEGVAERLEGYAATFAEHYDIEAGDIALVISNSGINPVPLEVALYAQGRGATVVALTSLAHSNSMASRHSSGKKLYQLADIVLDTQVPAGDAICELDPTALKVGPVSTVIGAALLNAVVTQTARNVLAAGGEPPVLVSANVAIGDEHNRRLAARYWQRLTKFPRLGSV